MSGLSFISTMSLDLPFMSLGQEYMWLLIPALLVLSLSLMLRMGKVFAAQVLLLLGFFAAWSLSASALFIGLIVLQIGLTIWMAIRLVTEIEWSFTRRLEKTHFLPRSITKNGNAGIRDYRF